MTDEEWTGERPEEDHCLSCFDGEIIFTKADGNLRTVTVFNPEPETGVTYHGNICDNHIEMYLTDGYRVL